ncbi:hypothetical protein BGZ76_008541 [Entomortierella beljakovae]|nr:hypothetical protein BGZ76_008541 [Entomortierella beljakovae]
MKTDNKSDPPKTNKSPAPVSHQNNTKSNSNGNNNNSSHSHSNKKRKTTPSERHPISSNGGQSISTNAAPQSDSTPCRSTYHGSASDDRKKKRASIDEHTREEHGQTEASGGNMRKKRVLSSPYTNTRPQNSKANVIKSTNTEPENNTEIDIVMVESDQTSNSAMNRRETLSKAKDAHHNAVNYVADIMSSETPKSRTNSELKKSRIVSHAAPVSPMFSYNSEQIHTVPTELIPSEPSLQKRVLPSRGRDKTRMIPIEPSLLEPPLTPAGDYILYLANSHIFQKTTINPHRVPVATFNGGSNDLETNQSSSELTSKSPVDPSGVLRSIPPPSSVTHIEVPIFKSCTVGQFLQEEKKRKMQLLSRALAKAEAETATEARSNNTSQFPQRAVSTRQKHKVIVHNQHVSVQMAAPTSSSTLLIHGRKSTTTNTTLGKIEGVSLDPSQEEMLADEVYEKRHRKQEMAEKKVKNREKEKLRHAMYQQQLVIEKLRHIEINRLMPISAFRSLQKSAEQEQHQHHQSFKNGSSSASDEQATQGPISLAAARILQDEYRRRLLQEAEENLRRYEQLGLGENYSASSAPMYSSFSRTKNRIAAMIPILSTSERISTSPSSSLGGKVLKSDISIAARSSSVEGRARKKTKKLDLLPADIESAVIASSGDVKPEHPRTKNAGTKKASSQKSSTLSSISDAKADEPLIPPKPITTFVKPGAIIASGGRKSSRVALAFGEKVPTLERIDFDLPFDVFGDLIQERIGVHGLVRIDADKKAQEAMEGLTAITSSSTPIVSNPKSASP